MNNKGLLSVLFVTLSFLITGCNGSDEEIMPKSRSKGVVSGTAFDGLIINGQVTVYDFSDGEKGTILGSDITDGSGLYSVNIVSDEAPILLEVCGGQAPLTI